MNKQEISAQSGGAPWPQPRLRALQIDELYRHAPISTGFSYFGAALVLAVLIDTGDITAGAVWFLWATAVTFFRAAAVVTYRRRAPGSDPEPWGRLMIAANLLAGIQWGLLGTVLFPEDTGYRQLFTVMVITCFVGGSLPAYTAVRGAHEALSIPATIPTALNLFFVHGGIHWFAGATALFFCFAIVYYAVKLNRMVADRFRLQLERDDLLELTALLNEKLARENQELAHRAAMRSMSVESARERAGRLETLFEHSPLPQFECDASGTIITGNLAAERLFGLNHEQLAGRPFASLLFGRYADSKALAGVREAVSVEVEVRLPSGEVIPCTASYTPLAERPGRSPGFGVILSGMVVPA